MPRLAVLTIRAALLYLATGFTLGGLLLFNKGLPFYPAIVRVLPAHIEFLLFGWTFQLVIGVAFWIFPRFTREPKRGRVSFAWLSVVLLNLGIILAVVGPLMSASPWLTFFGRVMETGAVLVFAVYAWSRVKPAGT